MIRYFTAWIDWKSHDDGGRKKYPLQGTRYCPLIRLFNNGKYIEWSIDFICPDFNDTNIIVFTFLSKDAPYELIEINKTYSLFEGLKKVAAIKILNIEHKS